MMFLYQVAQEAIKQAGPVPSWTGWAVAGLAVAQVAGWFKIIFVDGRKAKAEADKAAEAAAKPASSGQPVPLPGNGLGTLLKDHGERLARHDEQIKGICEQIKDWRDENRQEHQRIFDKIDEVRDA